MKRYDFTSDDVCHSGCRMEEFEDGEYVRWEDVEPWMYAVMRMLRRRVEKVIKSGN